MTEQSDEAIARLHERARQQLRSPSHRFRCWQFEKELRPFQSDHPVMHSEALVMALLAGRKRAGRMRRTMAKLLQLRSKRGEMAAFRAFEGFLAEHAPEDALTGHNYDTVSFARQNHQEVWNHLSFLIKQLQPLSDGVFLNSGTLLGAVREGRLLDHDDDADLAFFLKSERPEDAAQEWRELQLKLFEIGLARIEDQIPGPGRIIKLVSCGSFEVDLFPAWKRNGKVFVYPHTFGKLTEAQVLPLQTCAATGLPLPAEPEAMLAVNYGAAWREPNPYFAFDWSRANRNFRRFLGALPEPKFKRVITYGTFDPMHYGHVRLLKRLSLLADEVIAACSTCEFNAGRGKQTALAFEHRVEMLEACKYVSKVIPEENWDQKAGDIRRLNADLLVMGSDWRGHFDDLKDLCTVLYLPRTEGISATALKAGAWPGAAA